VRKGGDEKKSKKNAQQDKGRRGFKTYIRPRDHKRSWKKTIWGEERAGDVEKGRAYSFTCHRGGAPKVVILTAVARSKTTARHLVSDVGTIGRIECDLTKWSNKGREKANTT